MATNLSIFTTIQPIRRLRWQADLVSGCARLGEQIPVPLLESQVRQLVCQNHPKLVWSTVLMTQEHLKACFMGFFRFAISGVKLRLALNGSLLHRRTLRPSSSMFFRSMLVCRGT